MPRQIELLGEISKTHSGPTCSAYDVYTAYAISTTTNT